MKICAMPENLIEQGAVAIGQVPTPSIETQASLMLAQVIMVATRLGIFEALVTPLTASEIAAACQVDATALQPFLDALANTGYLVRQGTKYELTAVARKWLLKESDTSLYDFTLSRALTWDWLSRLETFVRTGQGVKIHQEMTPEQWQLYHRGMRSMALYAAPEVATQTPVPAGASKLLDIGGSHGYFSALLCRRHPNLQAVILELPEAIAAAAPLLEMEGLSERITYQAGDVLTADLGTEQYDMILMSNLVHLFDAKTNLALFQRVVKALRSGGYLIVQKIMIPNKGEGQLGSFADLFLALTSAADNWSLKDISEWQKKAGLMPQKPIQFLKAPGSGQQVAIKP